VLSYIAAQFRLENKYNIALFSKMLPLKKDIKLVRSLQQKKFRNEHNLFVVEGKKMVDEALSSRFKLHSLYSTDAEYHTDKCNHVNRKEMEMMSSLSTASPYLAVLHKPSNTTQWPVATDNAVVVLDGIADPGNMGTILRTAEWFGLNQVFCTDDCVELYNPKVVQSTMGSLFRVHVHYASAEEIIAYLKENQYKPSGADMQGTSLYDYQFSTKEAIIIGSESHGIRATMRSALANNYITIPKQGDAESLNASIATSIILSELFRQKIK
jgi:TrmH family RNA methyltransferase